jgi:hypothetical protein
MGVAYTLRSITYTIFEVLEAEPGHWCPSCALSSAFRIHLATQVQGGPLRLSTGMRCRDCERWF